MVRLQLATVAQRAAQPGILSPSSCGRCCAAVGSLPYGPALAPTPSPSCTVPNAGGNSDITLNDLRGGARSARHPLAVKPQTWQEVGNERGWPHRELGCS